MQLQGSDKTVINFKQIPEIRLQRQNSVDELPVQNHFRVISLVYGYIINPFSVVVEIID